MSRQNRWLIINTGIIFIVSMIVTLLISDVFPTTKEDKLFDQAITLIEIEEIEKKPTGDYAIISTHYEAMNRQDVVVGDVYLLEIKNGYGTMSLYVGIQDDIIYTQNITLDQTSIYLKNIQHFIQDELNGIGYDALTRLKPLDAAYDLDSGATATDSTASILALVIKAVEIHFDLYVDDPYIAYYGEEYTKVLDSTFVSESIEKYIINGNQTVYRITGTGSYEGYEETKSGSITLDVLLDENNQILGILFPEDLYGHTLSFLSRNASYINYFIGRNISEINNTLSSYNDLTTGATGSKELVETLLQTLFNEVSNNG
jgi:hypothetical protein